MNKKLEHSIMPNRQIAFKNVKLSEKFTTPNNKRLFGGVKISNTDTGEGLPRNAVILTDHTGQMAEDSGTLVTILDDIIVQVEK